MPDYGDDRGFRSRGVPANIGFDRMGGVDRMGGGYDRPFDRTVTTTDLMSGPPSNIGYDRAGPSRFGPPANIGFDRAGAGIFGGGGSSAYAANDIVDAIMGGMNRSQEGAGFDVAGGAFGSGSKSQRDNIRDINVYNMLVDKHGQVKADEIYGEYLRKKYELSGTGAPSGEYIPGGTKLVT